MKIILDVENADGLGVKTRMKKDKEGAKFTWRVMRPEFHQINRKGQKPTKIMKINLYVENACCLGVKKTLKRTNRGQNLDEN